MLAHQFDGIGLNQKIDLTSLVTTKDGVPVIAKGSLLLRMLSVDGRASETFQYTDDACTTNSLGEVEMNPTMPWLPLTTTGWVGEDGILINPGSVYLTAGHGIWIQSSDDTYALQQSGKVGVLDVERTLEVGVNLTGNPFPTNLDLTDILIMKDGNEIADGQVLLRSVGPDGRATATYRYTTDACTTNALGAIEMNPTMPWLPLTTTGWVNDNDERSIKIEKLTQFFKPGEGIWVQANLEGYIIRIPAPEL